MNIDQYLLEQPWEETRRALCAEPEAELPQALADAVDQEFRSAEISLIGMVMWSPRAIRDEESGWSEQAFALRDARSAARHFFEHAIRFGKRVVPPGELMLVKGSALTQLLGLLAVSTVVPSDKRSVELGGMWKSVLANKDEFGVVFGGMVEGESGELARAMTGALGVSPEGKSKSNDPGHWSHKFVIEGQEKLITAGAPESSLNRIRRSR